jgi:long-chain acyl-CoA synthetase
MRVTEATPSGHVQVAEIAASSYFRAALPISGYSGGFIEGFLTQVAAAPDAVAIDIEAGERVLTYRELKELMERFRSVFDQLGVQDGDRVLLLLPSGPELIASVYALASLSAIAVPVNPRMTAYEIEPILRDATPIAVVFHESRALRILRNIGPLRFALVTAPLPPNVDTHGIKLTYLDAITSWPSQLAAPDGETVVSCHFTYKGLGYPLGALHTYANYTHCIQALIGRYATTGNVVHLLGLPIYPVYSLLAAVMAPLAIGARLLIIHKIAKADLLDLLVRHQVRVVCMVPMLFAPLVMGAEANPEMKKKLHPDLVLSSGGTHLSEELTHAVIAALGIEPYQGYGLTETLPVVANHADRNLPGSLGVPLSDRIHIRIVDADGNEVPNGRFGEITVSGPTLMSGFIKRPKETAQFMRDGWFHTGDLGHIDSDGFLHFHGRSGPFTKVMAQMVDLVEIEQLLRSHPEVSDAKVTVTSGQLTGERLSVSVITKADATLDTNGVIEFCKAHLSPHKVPRKVMLYRRQILVQPRGQ